ncbi:hypothetical protein ACFFRL_15185 [Agromyces hippuratus]
MVPRASCDSDEDRPAASVVGRTAIARLLRRGSAGTGEAQLRCITQIE